MTGTPLPEQQRPRLRPSTAVLAVLVALAIGVPTALSGASFTSQSANTGRIGSAMDWTPPTVDLVDPGQTIRGTVTISADASDAETGIASVTISWAPSGTTTFTTLCTDTIAPYSCPFPTAGLPEDEVDLRAVAVDRTGLTATDLLEAVLVDNVAPTASVDAVASPLSGAATITVSATDAGSGVASVAVQYARSGTTTWTTICTDLESPWSCRWDTTTVALGLYDLRAIVLDGAGNQTTTASVRNRLVDNTISSVSVADPGPFLRGTVNLDASASAVLGVASVKIQRLAAGSSVWFDICTDASAPYTCSWNTTTVADGLYSFRAILTDTAGITTTSSVVGPSQVDNTPVRGYDVQATNGGTAAKVGPGDTISVTYTRTMRATSLLAGWDGTARTVTVRLRDAALVGSSAANDTVDVFTTTAYSTAVNLGSVNLKGNYIKGGKTAGFAATMTMQAVTVNGAAASRITLTIGAQTAGNASWVRSAGTSLKPVMVWTPSALGTDTTGVATSPSPTLELGTADADL